MKKVVLGICFLLISSVLVFYFWGSSSHYSSSKYDEIKSYHNNYKQDVDTLKIMTYNIGYLSGMSNNLAVDRTEKLFSFNLSRAVEILALHQPDFVGFQEIDFGSERSYNYHQLDSLALASNYPNAALAINWDKSYVPFPYWPLKYHFGSMLSGQAILSKMQINTNELIVLEKPASAPFYYKQFYLDRLIQISKVIVNGKALILMNVHLEAFDRETRESQAKVLLQIFEEYADDYPVLLFGDFNASSPFAKSGEDAESTVAIFVNHPLLGIAIDETTYLKDEAKYFTFDSENPSDKIDYIFYTKDKIEKIDADVLREAGEISDHLPVWMRFRLK